MQGHACDFSEIMQKKGKQRANKGQTKGKIFKNLSKNVQNLKVF